jgi:hypothetical protein
MATRKHRALIHWAISRDYTLPQDYKRLIVQRRQFVAKEREEVKQMLINGRSMLH